MNCRVAENREGIVFKRCIRFREEGQDDLQPSSKGQRGHELIELSKRVNRLFVRCGNAMSGRVISLDFAGYTWTIVRIPESERLGLRHLFDGRQRRRRGYQRVGRFEWW